MRLLSQNKNPTKKGDMMTDEERTEQQQVNRALQNAEIRKENAQAEYWEWSAKEKKLEVENLARESNG